MGNKNAYFSLKILPEKTILVLEPATGSGKNIDFTELDEYLTTRKIEYDKKNLYEATLGLSQTREFLLSTVLHYQEDEAIKVMISSDKRKVTGRFYPPSQDGSLLTQEQIITAMVSRGVKFGADEKEIQLFLKERNYCTDYIIAKGMEPIEGESAQIKYYFNTDTTQKPRTNDDGSVDFHQLDNIVHVTKDMLVAELIPAVQGKAGLDVCGTPIRPISVAQKALKYGKHIRANEDRTKIYSEVDGHITLVEDTVFVSDTYEVAADVDATTGDITYDGNVNVKGNVRTGYKITSKGDIIVNGVVEGAILEAEGQIVLKLGIQGMNRAILNAGSNIVTKFIENAEVRAGGFITTEAIMHSKVSAQGDITVNGKKSFITGGEVRSASLIHTKVAGSTMGTATVLEVGVDPQIVEDYKRMEKELPSLRSEVERNTQNLAIYLKKLKNGDKMPPDKLLAIKNLQEANRQLTEKIAEYQESMDSMQTEMENNENGCIKVIDTIYPGCKIVISGVIQFVRAEVKHCRFIRDKADIKMMTY